MKFEDYTEYMDGKSFIEILREFGYTSERAKREALDSFYGKVLGKSDEAIEECRREADGQRKRQEWLFQKLIKLYDEKRNEESKGKENNI